MLWGDTHPTMIKLKKIKNLSEITPGIILLSKQITLKLAPKCAYSINGQTVGKKCCERIQHMVFNSPIKNLNHFLLTQKSWDFYLSYWNGNILSRLQIPSETDRNLVIKMWAEDGDKSRKIFALCYIKEKLNLML